MFIAFGGCGLIESRFARGPEIQRGEFPFRLEYEVNEEIFVVEDALVIEFDGNDWNAGFGTHPTWRGSLASGRDRIVLFANEEVEIFYRPITLSTSLGVFMGDRILGGRNVEDFISEPMSIFRTKDDNTRVLETTSLEGTQFYMYSIYYYNMRIISWEIAPPIENTFP